MTETERLILENQRLIMRGLTWLLWDQKAEATANELQDASRRTNDYLRGLEQQLGTKMDILERLRDLLQQATVERGHYYTGSAVKAAIEEIERLTRERDEWKEKWVALAQAALIVGGQDKREDQ